MTTIYELRVSKDLSQRTLAKMAGVSIPTIMKLEKGIPVLKKSFLDVCEALGVAPDTVTDVNVYSGVQTFAKRRMKNG